jgi:hypothetical protein
VPAHRRSVQRPRALAAGLTAMLGASPALTTRRG